MDSNRLTKTKNWSSRNKVTETSGRPHPLWPQNKWLHTPRTTDYRHTGQDRWLQTELAFTLAKNATKPNPFEIIPLQATRKENNWNLCEVILFWSEVKLVTVKFLGTKVPCTLVWHTEGTWLYCDYFIWAYLVLWLFELVLCFFELVLWLF